MKRLNTKHTEAQKAMQLIISACDRTTTLLWIQARHEHENRTGIT